MTDLESMQDKGLRLAREEQERFARLEVPLYTNRKLSAIKVEKWDGKALTDTDGWTHHPSSEVAPHIFEGLELLRETSRGNRITGYLIDGKWYGRDSDQDLDREAEVFRSETKARHQAIYEANKEKWEAEEAALPDWIRPAVQNEDDSWKTEPMGYGYALVIARLAVLYAEMGPSILDKDMFTVEDSEEITKLSREEGTSGNQHGMALGFAKQYLRVLEHSKDLPEAWETEDGVPVVLGTNDREKASELYRNHVLTVIGLDENSEEYFNSLVAPEEWEEIWMKPVDFLAYKEDELEQWTWEHKPGFATIPAFQVVR